MQEELCDLPSISRDNLLGVISCRDRGVLGAAAGAPEGEKLVSKDTNAA